MAGTEITILEKKYVFLGVRASLAEEIQQLAAGRIFQEDFEIWKRWMLDVTKDEVILVCDPYEMKRSEDEQSLNEIIAEGTAALTQGLIEQKAADAAEALLAQVGKRAVYQVKMWKTVIEMMFSNYNAARVYGMQYSDGRIVGASVGAYDAILFIDFQSVVNRKRELLLPVLIHETTHFLEQKTLNGGCFGESGILSEMKDDGRLWSVENAGSLGKDTKSGWQAILADMEQYQSANVEERMTSLVEKMAIGSLCETIDRGWVEYLKSIVVATLDERKIKF